MSWFHLPWRKRGGNIYRDQFLPFRGNAIMTKTPSGWPYCVLGDRPDGNTQLENFLCTSSRTFIPRKTEGEIMIAKFKISNTSQRVPTQCARLQTA
eukprot:scaffold137971_cov14-Tisochrysis_lutea.AAC.1